LQRKMIVRHYEQGKRVLFEEDKAKP